MARMASATITSMRENPLSFIAISFPARDMP